MFGGAADRAACPHRHGPGDLGRHAGQPQLLEVEPLLGHDLGVVDGLAQQVLELGSLAHQLGDLASGVASIAGGHEVDARGFEAVGGAHRLRLRRTPRSQRCG